MSRRSSRRMWHAVAAFVLLPLIGLGLFVAVTESRLAHEAKLLAVSSGSLYSATWTSRGFAPSVDKAVTRADRQLITASLGGTPGLNAVVLVHRAAKADRMKPTSSEMALKVPDAGRAENSLFMNASYSSPFNADFQVEAFRPSVEEVAYHSSQDALEFRYKGETQPEFEERERRCLSTALYFEARGEPRRGQIAVAQVILNRVRSPLYPETICGVVFQGQMRKGCQFSFACDGHTDNPRNKELWASAQGLAKEVMTGDHWLPEVGYSLFYHANYVKPRWARHMRRIDKIGQHIFYKHRNEKPYVIEASADAVDDGADADAGYLMAPTLSLASAVRAFTGTTEPTSQAMSLGYAASE